MGLECTKIPAIRAAGAAGGGSGGTVSIDLAPSRFLFLIIGLNRASFKPVGSEPARLAASATLEDCPCVVFDPGHARRAGQVKGLHEEPLGFPAMAVVQQRLGRVERDPRR
jgi:hypothetical protein